MLFEDVGCGYEDEYMIFVLNCGGRYVQYVCVCVQDDFYICVVVYEECFCFFGIVEFDFYIDCVCLFFDVEYVGCDVLYVFFEFVVWECVDVDVGGYV